MSYLAPVTETGKLLYGGTIALDQRHSDWLAFIIGEPTCFATGPDYWTAINRLLEDRPELRRLEPR